MSNMRDIKFSFAAGVITSLLLFPILLNLEQLNTYTAGAALVYPIVVLLAMWIVNKLALNIIWLLQFAKFVITGAMNTILDMGLLNLLSFLTGIYSGPFILLLNSLSFTVAVTNSYFWNKHWTFAHSSAVSDAGNLGGAGAVQYLQFIAVSFVGLLLNGSIVYAITTYAPMDGLTPAMMENAAKLFATFMALFWNFAGYKFFVFKA